MNKKIKIIGTLALVFALLLTLQIDSFAREKVYLDREVKAKNITYKEVIDDLLVSLFPIYRFIKVDVNQRFDDLELSKDDSFSLRPIDGREVLNPKDNQKAVPQSRSKVQKID